VEDGENGDSLSSNSVRKKVGGSGDDEFTSAGMATGAAETRVDPKAVCNSDDANSDGVSGFGLVLRDVGADIRQLSDRGGRPDYLHEGGGSSFAPPQESSQRRTSAWGTDFPAAISASAFSRIAS